MEIEHSSINALRSEEQGQYSLSKHYCIACLQFVGDDDAILRHYDESPVCLKFLQEHVSGEGKQTNLDIAWTLSKSEDFLDFILPLAKSSGWRLPGHGRSYATCGTPRVSVCDNVEKHPEGKELWRYGIHSCNRKDCPICREAWGASEAERSLIRFASYASFPNHSKIRGIFNEAKAEAGGRVGRAFHRLVCARLEDSIRSSWRGSPIHVMVSPPQDVSYLKADFASLRRRAEKIASLSGLGGGNIVFHPYRLHCRLCDSIIPDYKKVCPKCGQRVVVWVNGPHFHLIGYGFIKRAAKTYAKTGWVVKNLGVRKSVFWTIQYLLSHAGVFVDPNPGVHPKHFQVVSWFGKLGYRAKDMKGVPALKSPRAKCPYCGHYLRNGTVTELGRHPPPVDLKEHLEEDYMFAPV